ncbi:MAG: hypothetical protein M1837_000785 [Sclerophora amabilis]|nr:MAG: hypothetical protein M1837_000785 [Sclerophora amabilis]
MDDDAPTSSARRKGSPARPARSMRRTRAMTASQSPERRTHRTTRSQSRELGEGALSQTSRRNVRRRGRKVMGDYDSSASRDEEESEPDVGAARPTHIEGSILINRPHLSELSPVAEDGGDAVRYPEIALQYGSESETQDNGDRLYRPLESTRVSGISGTTAVSAQSMDGLQDVDLDIVVQELPELSSAAGKLLAVVSPPNMSAEEMVSIAEDLNKPGSKTSKSFRRLHRLFSLHREAYGSEKYINRSAIIRALYGVRTVQEAPSGNGRPDIIFQKANVATLASSLMLLSQSQSQDTHKTLQDLDDTFPNPFMSNFSTSDNVFDSGLAGSSDLKKETFEIALDLRTQLAISLLIAQPDSDPEEILSQVFLETPKHGQPQSSASTISSSQRKIKSWRLGDLTDKHFELLKATQVLTAKRMKFIVSFFDKSTQARRTSSTVDIGGLEKSFPWQGFILKLATWAQLRSKEIDHQIAIRGGIGLITEILGIDVEQRSSLIAEDGQNREVPTMNQVGTKDDQEVPNVGAAASPAFRKNVNNEDLQKIFGTQQAASRLRQRESARRSAQQALKITANTLTSHLSPSHTRPQPAADKEHSQSEPVQGGSQNHLASSALAETLEPNQRMQSPEDDEWRPQNMDDEDYQEEEVQVTPDVGGTMSVAEAIERYNRVQKDKNKENIHDGQEQSPAQPRKRFFNETQENRARVEPISEDEDNALLQPSAGNVHSDRKKARVNAPLLSEGEDSDVSVDQGFETNVRTVDPRRREAAPVSPRRRPVEISQASLEPSRGHRPTQDDSTSEDREDARAQRVTDLYRSKSAANRNSRYDSFQRSQSARSVPNFDYSQINQLAKRQVAERAPRKMQVRRPWSPEESSRLIELIENDEFCTSWSKIEALEDPLLEGRGQVKLKDRARNMKFDFLKAGVVLPHNFEYVTLKQTEKAKLDEMGIRYPMGG